MIEITNQQLDPNIWNQMVIEAANSRKGNEEHKNICRVIYPDNRATLELKTNKEIAEHFQKYGTWQANCGKMPLREVLNITRMSRPDLAVSSQIKEALTFFASRADQKYNNGLQGLIRKIISIFFNLFTTDSVRLFQIKQKFLGIRLKKPSLTGKLPYFIGSDADFARLINHTHLS